ncbi:MAG: hydroxymethylbilane synthase [Thermomicrobiales bacterium]
MERDSPAHTPTTGNPVVQQSRTNESRAVIGDEPGPAPLRIGTRGSALALWQANAVRDWLAEARPDVETEITIVNSDGDRDKESPLSAIGGRGVFASALQARLLSGEIDMAVHTTKDVPGITPAGLILAAFPVREDARDVLISRHGVELADLPANPVIGTSSKRRAVQLRALRPDVRITELRGNIDTRLRKARGDAYDAIVLAAAGLLRMGWDDAITEYLPVDTFTPAPGQGVLGIETREAPDRGWPVARTLDDATVRTAVLVERAFLRGVGGGCTTPIGAYAEAVSATELRFRGMLASEDGSRIERVDERFAIVTAEDDAFQLARQVQVSIQPRWTGVSLPGAVNPLTNALVVVTASPDVADGQAAALRAVGAEPLVLPTVRIEPAADIEALDGAVASLLEGAFDWVMLTSANAVPVLADRVGGVAMPVKVAAVGARTADALSNAGIGVDLVPDVGSADGMLAALADAPMAGSRVLLLLSDIARPTLAEGLRAMGADVTIATAYRTLPVTRVGPDTLERLQSGDPAAVFLSSPSAVEALDAMLGADITLLTAAFGIAIGETTAAAMREAGMPVHAVATTPTPAGMIAALESCYAITPERRDA